MNKKIKIGISRCLMGEKVRFDGGHKHYSYVTELLSQFFDIQAICPEVESGLPIPRPAIHLQGTPEAPSVVEVLKPENDHTERLLNYSKNKVKGLSDLSGFILKSKSPSCGMERVKIYQASPLPPQMGSGVFAKELMNAYPLLPVEEEGRLNEPSLRENFIERVFVYYRWQAKVLKDLRPENLLAFHTEHKLTLLAHHQQAYRELGQVLANLKEVDMASFSEWYFSRFMAAMKRRADRKTHSNVLMHIQGYFKEKIDSQDKAELKDTIERYRLGQLPLIVPITLLKHQLLKHPDEYLQNQRYLFPYPEELMLRNHI